MKKFEEYIAESLAAEVKSEPKTNASKEARRLGLTYVGFGRYTDKTGKVAYLVDNDRLVPYKSREEVQSMYAKTVASPGQKQDPKQAKSNDAIAYNKILNSREKQDSQIVKQKTEDMQILNQQLYNFYKPNMFDENELGALQWYTEDGYEVINPYLYKGHDEGTSQEQADDIDNTIAAIDSAFEDTEAPFAYTVYSGLSSRYRPEKLKPGNDYIFRGYVSTSIDFTTAVDSFADADMSDSPVVLQIEIAKGQKSIYVDPISSNGGEGETLLPRGSKVKIISGPHKIGDELIASNPSGATIHLFHCQLIEDV